MVGNVIVRDYTKLVRIVTFAVVIGIVGLVTVLPLANAQDGTPYLEPTPPLLKAPLNTPDRTKQVVSVPFSDTFDTAESWIPTGAWSFDTESAYDGTGWFLDGTRRETRY